jgi:hypothetical protein
LPFFFKQEALKALDWRTLTRTMTIPQLRVLDSAEASSDFTDPNPDYWIERRFQPGRTT